MAVPKPFGERPLIISVIGIDGVLCNTAVDCPATGGLYLRSCCLAGGVRVVLPDCLATVSSTGLCLGLDQPKKNLWRSDPGLA